MKSQDATKELAKLQKSILQEKATLEAKLEQINKALGDDASPSPRSGKAVHRKVRNEIPLKDAIIHVTTGKSLTKDQILEAVQKLGYVFQTSNPKNSINVVLYGSKKPKFKNDGGKFSPV